jgi:prolyl-tRNA synthetase
MLKAGLIHQTCSGIYSWLPLAFRILSKIEKIIEEEQDKIGGLRILMPTIQPAQLWKESGRYDDYGKEMLRIKDRHDREMLYGPTHEEVVTDLARAFLKSYKQLPIYLYQITWKFRDEIRPRFGVMRGREFLMKDGYSFDLTAENAKEAYKKVVMSYLKIFHRLGLKSIPIRAETGAIGGNLSHEFHIVAETGESDIFYDKRLNELDLLQTSFEDIENIYAAADERHNPERCPIRKPDLCQAKGIEVGHVFYFGTKYSKAMNLSMVGKDGQFFYPEMGSYGIGVSRLIGALVEVYHDQRGIIWPDSVAPFLVALILLKKDENIRKKAEQLYQELRTLGIEVLLDDRDESAGIKFSDMDLIGIPYHILVGTQAIDDQFDWKDRRSANIQTLSYTEILNKAKSLENPQGILV